MKLARDLQTGITYYAPGSQIVADKAIWEPEGLRIPQKDHLPEYRYGECVRCEAFKTAHTVGGDEKSLGECQACGHPDVTASDTFVVPMFGFVGRKSKQKPSDARPKRSGWAQSYFSDYAKGTPDWEPIGAKSASAMARYSRQGRITAVNKGPKGAGFKVCAQCGFAELSRRVRPRRNGEPPTHTRPGTNWECGGYLAHRHFGHQYLTDVLELMLPTDMTLPQSLSTLYALLAAMPAISIPADDVDGLLRPHRAEDDAPSSTFIVFDTVPGGAGHVRRVKDRFAELLEQAAANVSACECPKESSCYGCLRTYRNQRHHDELTRRAALDIIQPLTTGH